MKIAMTVAHREPAAPPSSPAASGIRRAARTEENLHQMLGELGRLRRVPSAGHATWDESLIAENAFRRLENAFVRQERSQVTTLARTAPRDADGFVRWFGELRNSGPGQGDVLFSWLAEAASSEDMRWFLKQQVAAHAGFADLVAATQPGLPSRARLALARLSWDAMGRGIHDAAHESLLTPVCSALHVEELEAPLTWEAQAIAHAHGAFAHNRRFAYQSLGALGAVMVVTPAHEAMVGSGLRRLGLSKARRLSFALHRALYRHHAPSFLAEVLWPIVAEEPTAAFAVAEGALVRLAAGARAFVRYRQELGVDDAVY